MNWITSLRDQLPLLLVLSPLIGFFATCLASRLEPKLVWHVAVSNMLCTSLILCGLEWRLEADAVTDVLTVEAASQELSETVNRTESLISVHRMQDRLRAERLREQWFEIDGINLFPLLLVVLIVFSVTWQLDERQRQDRWGIPLLLLFEAAALGALTVIDLRLFLFTTLACGLLTSIVISQSGYGSRRDHAERLLKEQCWSGALLMLGFSILAMAVPWMKIPDSTEIPTISWNIVSLVQDVQKWSARNELAFHYVGEVFPWMLMLLSLGLAMQSALFPFHTTQVRLLSDAPPSVAALYVVAPLAIGRVAWFRFAVPLAPDLLAAFDTWMLVPSFAGALWGAMAAISTARPPQRGAYVFMSLSAIAVFGSYCFTRFGAMGSWLMHQQIAVYACTWLIAMEAKRLPTGQAQDVDSNAGRDTYGARTVFLWVCLCSAGLFSSLVLIVGDLMLENLYLVVSIVMLCVLVAVAVLGWIRQRWQKERQEPLQIRRPAMSGPFLLTLLLAVTVTIHPSWLLQQSEPEFARIFRRFEQSDAADSAETDSIEQRDQE